MKRVPSHTSATTSIIMVGSILSLAWYASFVFSPAHIGNPVAYALLVTAEVIGMWQLLCTWTTVLFEKKQEMPMNVQEFQRILKKGQQVPSIAVLITAAGERLEVIRQTAIAARDMQLEHRTIILDDGASDLVEEMAKEEKVEYVRRGTREGKKAGNINHALQQIDAEFFVIFDCDHTPKKDFLLQTLPYLLARENLAFVQTPQSYGNTHTFIAGGSAEIQGIFYRHVQGGKNAFNAAFCVGTNVIFRRAAIDDIRGMYQKSNSEDIWTSLLLHEKGWDSLFLPQVLAVGHAPETLDAYLRQQFRWSRGGFEIFFTHNPLRSKTLSLDQKLQYLFTITHYFSSITILIFFILPLLYVYFGIRPLESPEGSAAWAVHFFPYYFLIFASVTHLMGHFPRWRGLVVATASFSSHIMAMLSVITHLDLRWSVTGEIRKSTDHIQGVVPQILLLLLSLGAIPTVLLQYENAAGLNILMAVWLAWNSALLFSVCKRALPYFDKSHSSSVNTVLASVPELS
jgi:cellulose synthase (UDP-forming)